MDTVFVILQSSQRSQILHKKISTHLLTLLIMGVILHLEQRKGNDFRKFIVNKNGGMTYDDAQCIWKRYF